MGLFGKLFDKKICDICGGEIGLLGNRKLEDGNCCKECASLLSPFLTDRRGSTVEEIRAHIAYREANRQQLPYFRVSRVYGDYTKIYFDDEAGRFMVTPVSNWLNANPDIIDIAQVADCQIDINESRFEEFDRTPEGQRVSFNPKRYRFSYSFYIRILVNSPWFEQIEFKLSGESPDARFSPLYHEYEKQADEIRMTLLPGAEPQAQYLEPPEPPRPRVVPIPIPVVGRPVRPEPAPVPPQQPRPEPRPMQPEPPHPVRPQAPHRPAEPHGPARPMGPQGVAQQPNRPTEPHGPAQPMGRPTGPQPARPMGPQGGAQQPNRPAAPQGPARTMDRPTGPQPARPMGPQEGAQQPNRPAAPQGPGRTTDRPMGPQGAAQHPDRPAAPQRGPEGRQGGGRFSR